MRRLAITESVIKTKTVDRNTKKSILQVATYSHNSGSECVCVCARVFHESLNSQKANLPNLNLNPTLSALNLMQT